jgi:hypothetical protein
MMKWCVRLERPSLLGCAESVFDFEHEAMGRATFIEKCGYQFGIFVEHRDVVPVEVGRVTRWDFSAVWPGDAK